MLKNSFRCASVRCLRLLISFCTLLVAFPGGTVAVEGAPVRLTTAASDVAVVERLLELAHVPLDQVQDIHRVTAKSAFCNALYRVTTTATTTTTTTTTSTTTNKRKSFMAKVFSPLAAARMHWNNDDIDEIENNNSHLFRIDALTAKHNLGPEIFATIASPTEPALLMEDCPGRVLTEQDLRQDEAVVRLAAAALAKLHGLSSSSLEKTSQRGGPPPNMLWQSCNVLMQQFANPTWNANTGQQNQVWTYDRLVDCLNRHQESLEQQKDNLLITHCGHGDCKPSNLLLYEREKKKEQTIRFLDMELAGTHYVAFDLAKLWRSSIPKTTTARNMQRLFLETYAGHCGNGSVNASLLEQQVDQLAPLTWLEAAAFFVAMSSSSKSISERENWDKLALERLRSYEECLSA